MVAVKGKNQRNVDWIGRKGGETIRRWDERRNLRRMKGGIGGQH